MRDWLARTITWPSGTSLVDLRLNRVWFGRHAKLTAEFELTLQIGDHEVITAALQAQTINRPSRKPPRTEAVLTEQGLADLRFENAELQLHCCTPDRDRGLPVLRDLLHRGQTSTLFEDEAHARRVLGAMVDHPARFETIAYRIGKRCVLRMKARNENDSPSLFVKVFRRPPSQRLLQAQRMLADSLATQSDGKIATPRVLGFSVDDTVLFTEAITETTELRSSEPGDVNLAARCAVALHAADVSIDRRHTPLDEFGTVCRWVQGLRRIGTARSDVVARLVTEIAPLLPDALDSSPAIIHRDFYCKQLLRRADRLYVTDLDTLCLGDREQDVATFAAHLILEAIEDGRATGEAIHIARDFTAAYREHGGVLSVYRLRFYLACALTRLGAIHTARGTPDNMIDLMWTAACDAIRGTLPL